MSRVLVVRHEGAPSEFVTEGPEVQIIEVEDEISIELDEVLERGPTLLAEVEGLGSSSRIRTRVEAIVVEWAELFEPELLELAGDMDGDPTSPTQVMARELVNLAGLGA